MLELDGYRINPEPNSFVLQKRRRNRKSGKTEWTNVSYHGTLEQALKGYAKKASQRALEKHKGGVDSLLKELSRINQTIAASMVLWMALSERKEKK